MPAEWEPHRGTWLAWPHKESDWPGKLATIVTTYTEIVRTVSRFETVRLIVADEGRGKGKGEGFGSRMMAAMVQRLNGTLDYLDNAPG
ncbi:MAG: agmatine deiminase family protein, partial [Gemmataceae bacterium]